MNKCICKIYDLGLFFASALYYFIPCAIGSIVSEFVKKAKGKKEKISIKNALVYSIAPTILITSADIYITDKLTYDDMAIGIAFICGFIASDINGVLISIKALIQAIICARKVFKNITDSKVLDTLQKLSEELTDEGNTNNANNDDNKVDKENNE